MHRLVTEADLKALAYAYEAIAYQTQIVRSTGAVRAAEALRKALRSLDGAIRYAKKVREDQTVTA